MTAIILTHNGARETHERHARHWNQCFEQVLCISPRDDYLPGSIPLGESERYGDNSIERMLMASVFASRFPSAAIIEYDTLLLKAPPKPKDGELHCSSLFDNQGNLFSAPIYGHSPWVATGATWWKIALAGSDPQFGFPDRWLANACRNAGVTMLRYLGGFSDDRWNLDTDARAIQAKGEGAWCFHGLKDNPVMYRILSGLVYEESIAGLVTP